LRGQRHGRWLEDLQQRLAETLGDLPCRVWLFGSRARGDWDGLSDTDLLVEADCAELAELAADKLRAALVGDDVLAMDHSGWQAMAASPSPHWRAVHAQACFFATQAAEKALKGAILELGCEPAHTPVLGRLVEMLAAAGLDVSALASLPLAALSRMTVTTRYPLDDTPPSELFDARDSKQALGTAAAVLAWVEQRLTPASASKALKVWGVVPPALALLAAGCAGDADRERWRRPWPLHPASRKGSG
jgi:HEPN domain-containing protein